MPHLSSSEYIHKKRNQYIKDNYIPLFTVELLTIAKIHSN